MTIREAIELVDRLKPNQYGSADKLRWLSELDGAVWHEIWSAHETAVPAFTGYGPEADLDGTALLIGWPYDEIYRWYRNAVLHVLCYMAQIFIALTIEFA